MEKYKRNPNTVCAVCKKPIYRRPGVLATYHGNAYCGSSCYGLSLRKETPCVVCGKPILASANKKTCSRPCANTNRAGIKYTGRPLKDNVVNLRMIKKRLFDSRGKLCERCGYNVYQILQVHHKNRDPKNNASKNLEILCPNCHAKEHYFKNE